MDEKIVAKLRVTNCQIKPKLPTVFHTPENPRTDQGFTGEVIEVRASGVWGATLDGYPVSLHIIVYPGCGAIPVIGDNINVTIERA